MNTFNLAHLKNLSDLQLIKSTEACAKEELNALTKVLHHLREIHRRRLFSSMGYQSLFDFVVKHLKYSEDQAYRRISAMKLLVEIPEVEEKIKSGELSLTHLGIAQSLFRQEKKTHHKEMPTEEKLSVLSKIANKSVREAERITLSLSSSPEQMKPDRVQVISEDRIELKFSASKELQEKIEKLKGLLAHQHPNMNLGELFEKLCDLGLSEWDPTKTSASRKRRVRKAMPDAHKKEKMITVDKETKSNRLVSRGPKSDQLSNGEAFRIDRADSSTELNTAMKTDVRSFSEKAQVNSPFWEIDSAKLIPVKREAIPSEIKRLIFLRAQNKCENCGSSYALQIDHIHPAAKGGASTAANLRLLCRTCNQRAAITEFGLHKMRGFLSSRQ